MTPLLDVRNLSVRYGHGTGAVMAVQDLSFQIQPGETVALVGESGSGKTVTALSLLGLLDISGGEVLSGSALLQSDSVRSDPLALDLLTADEQQLERVRGDRLAMIFQEPMTALNPVFSIGEQIAESLRRHRGLDRAQARQQAIDLLHQVRISDPEQRIDQYPHQLSGGMRQRVMIAMAICCKPALLIADEPTTALDVTVQAQILELLRTLRHEMGMAMLFVTHDMGVVAEIADRVIVMRHGRKQEENTVRQLFEAPQHAYTKTLLQAVPRLGSMQGKAEPEPFALLDETLSESPDEPLSAESNPAEPAADKTTQKPETALLQVTDLSVRFPVRGGLWRRIIGHVQAVNGVSLQLQSAETLAIVGESGSGKSTLARAILRLLEPAAGEIRFADKTVSALTEDALFAFRREAQMIFQDPYAALNPRIRVGAAIAEPLLLHRMVEAGEVAALVTDLLRQVGLDASFARRFPRQLSGGQRQRICIARALGLKPKLIVADEPVSALDVSIQAQIINLMLELQQAFGLSYLFISHDMAVVERISHRVAVMYQGQIVEIGPRAAVFDSPQHPYTQKLLAAVPSLDPARHRLREAASPESVRGQISAISGQDMPIAEMLQAGAGHFFRAY